MIRQHKPKPLVLSEKGKKSLSEQKTIVSKIKEVSKNISGLGDVVESVAQPIAKAIDFVAKTNVQGCGGCKQRKKYLNKKFPFNK